MIGVTGLEAEPELDFEREVEMADGSFFALDGFLDLAMMNVVTVQVEFKLNSFQTSS